MMKLVKEDFLGEDMGGVSTPMATLNNTPGMGTAVPPSQNGTGSGDRWDNAVNKKPYTQSVNKKKKSKVLTAKARPKSPLGEPKKKMNEENINPYDKGAQMIIAAMKSRGHEVEQPFEKKDSKTNTVKQKDYDKKPRKKSAYTKPVKEEFSIFTLEEYAAHINEEKTSEKESLKYINGRNKLKDIGIAYVFKMIDDKHQIAFIKDDMEEVEQKLKEDGWKKGDGETKETGKIDVYTKGDEVLSIYTGEFDHPYVTLMKAKKEEPSEEPTI